MPALADSVGRITVPDEARTERRSHGLDHGPFAYSEITPILRRSRGPLAWEQRDSRFRNRRCRVSDGCSRMHVREQPGCWDGPVGAVPGGSDLGDVVDGGGVEAGRLLEDLQESLDVVRVQDLPGEQAACQLRGQLKELSPLHLTPLPRPGSRGEPNVKALGGDSGTVDDDAAGVGIGCGQTQKGGGFQAQQRAESAGHADAVKPKLAGFQFGDPTLGAAELTGEAKLGPAHAAASLRDKLPDRTRTPAHDLVIRFALVTDNVPCWDVCGEPSRLVGRPGDQAPGRWLVIEAGSDRLGPGASTQGG